MVLGLVCALSAGAVAIAQPSVTDHQAVDGGEECRVDESARTGARSLPWQEFDQTGDHPGSFRHLANNGCLRAALTAYDDWLANGPGYPDQRAQAIGTFHRAQLMAMLGDVATARTLLARAMRTKSEEDPRAEIWNHYVRGVIAYFVQDRAALANMIAELGRDRDDPFAVRQIGVLQGLLDCFDRDYQTAMSSLCRR